MVHRLGTRSGFSTQISIQIHSQFITIQRYIHHMSYSAVCVCHGGMYSGGMRAAPAGLPSSRRKLNVAHALGYK